MTRWYKITVEIISAAEELASSILYEKGSRGIELFTVPAQNKTILVSYHQLKPELNGLVHYLKRSLNSVFPGERSLINISLEEYKEIDWVKRQADSLGVIRITKEIWVIPPWKNDLQYKDDRKSVV